ncbi:SDR family NAD(P)-dependent oxidoreductase [Imtechella halotolerans]|uniref:Short chain dehydrogenase/reductase family oxidoreductase n=1 Tax=Imtechella halotolerans K1 TaxID=946077 RepID=I0WFZ5_9FLAO|nr:SDR family NAD(P)-dependent oxidoreductase [Imtechella halotolerans]EID75311.1 short chain dehydrogenase/reductase family oxidoreductase [Imtechella halotolerans K1]WMQ63946.1 SDR family NAD(P)-dependent oxidoreductase [Imtechella halotolerans]
MNSTKEKVVWITGASSGIGKAMAHKWSQLGYKVVLSARRQELLKAIAMGIKDSGGEALVIPVDIMEETSIEKAVQQIITSLGRLDVVVANAGFGVIGSIEKLTAKDWNRQLQGNVTGLALTVKYALPYLEKTNGRIGLVGSIAAYLPNPYVGAYGASKAAVNSIGKTLQVELKNSGVSCTTLHPGFVVSEIARVDNDGVWHPDRPDPRPSNLMWPTDKAAKVMVRAILKRKRNYVFTGHGRILVWLQRWFPGLVRTIISKGPKPEL